MRYSWLELEIYLEKISKKDKERIKFEMISDLFALRPKLVWLQEKRSFIKTTKIIQISIPKVSRLSHYMIGKGIRTQ